VKYYRQDGAKAEGNHHLATDMNRFSLVGMPLLQSLLPPGREPADNASPGGFSAGEQKRSSG
jgi:hypothetical protein